MFVGSDGECVAGAPQRASSHRAGVFGKSWGLAQRWTCGGAANAFGGTPATLAEVLAFTPAHVGFDIELKFDSRTISTPEERRRHLEATYAEVGAVADQRVLFFSSFDPSACVDMRAMQDEYPVLMLTCMDETSADHRQVRVLGLGCRLAWVIQ